MTVNNRVWMWAATGLVAILAGGCAAKQAAKEPPVADENRPAQQWMQAQAAAGAAEDATLYALHFTDGRVNALGQEKLRLILAGAAADAPQAIYVSVPSSLEAAQACRNAAADYLKKQDVAESRYKLELGVNPGAGSSASAGLAARAKMDSAAAAPAAAAQGESGDAAAPSFGGEKTGK